VARCFNQVSAEIENGELPGELSTVDEQAQLYTRMTGQKALPMWSAELDRAREYLPSWPSATDIPRLNKAEWAPFATASSLDVEPAAPEPPVVQAPLLTWGECDDNFVDADESPSGSDPV